VDESHAARTDLLQHAVIAEQQAVDVAGQDTFELKGGQQTSLDEGLADLDLAEVLAQPVEAGLEERAKRGAGDQPEPDEVIEEAPGGGWQSCRPGRGTRTRLGRSHRGGWTRGLLHELSHALCLLGTSPLGTWQQATRPSAVRPDNEKVFFN